MGAEVVAGGLDDASGDFVEGEVVGLDAEVGGVAVERGSDFQEVADGAFRIGGVKEGAVGVARGTVKDFGRLGDEPDDVAEFAEKFSIFFPSDDATAGGDDVAGVFVEGMEDVGFDVAEGLLAFGGEDFGNGAALLFDDDVVRVDERVAESLGKVSSDGGLTGSHKSDEDNVPLHALKKV